MKPTLTYNHFKFSTLLILSCLPGCFCRCSHSVHVAMVPGDIVFNGYEKNGCVWTLYSPDMNGLKLSVISTSFKEKDCSGSKLEIKDGTQFGGHVADICSSKRTIKVEGHYTQIVYHASPSYRRDTFRLRYTVYDTSVCKAGYRLAESHESIIYSPNYPVTYPRNLNCKWLLDSGSASKQIHLEVKDSHIAEYGRVCIGDYVEAFDGSSSTAMSLGRWCGKERPSKQSTGQYMYLRFRSDEFLQNKGFKIAYRTLGGGLESTKVGGIVGGVVVAVVVLIVLLICVYCSYKCKCLCFSKRSPERQYGSYPSSSSASNVYSIALGARHRTNSESSVSSEESLPEIPPRTEDLPPAYDDVIKSEPPSYFQAVSDISQSTNQNSRYHEISLQIREHPGETLHVDEASPRRGAENSAFQSD